MPLLASGVKLLEPLKKPLGAINQKGQASLQDALGAIQEQETASANASGRVQGSYIPQAIGQAGISAGHGIEDTLGSVLGGGSYKDYQSEQDYQRNLEIARQIAKANKPSVLQEVLGGLGGAAGLVGAGAGIYGSMNKKKPYTPTSMPDYSRYTSGGSGLNLF